MFVHGVWRESKLLSEIPPNANLAHTVSQIIIDCDRVIELHNNVESVHVHCNKCNLDAIVDAINTNKSVTDVAFLDFRKEDINIITNALSHVRSIQLIPDEDIRQPFEISIRNIKNLNVTHMSLTQDVLKTFKQFSGLESVCLQDCALGNAGTSTLCDALQSHKELRVLELDYNDIGFIGAKSIGALLCRNSKIVTLNLANNYICAKGAEAIFDSAPLKYVSLRNNSIGDRGANIIAQFIRRHRTLRSICLNANRIGLKGVNALIRAHSPACRLSLKINHAPSASSIRTNIRRTKENLCCDGNPGTNGAFEDNARRRSEVADETTQWLLINRRLKLVSKDVQGVICSFVATRL